MVPAWGSSTRRILHPFTFVPSLGSVKILKITPGDTEVLIGSSVQIAAEIENPARKLVPATLFVRQADKSELAQAMLPDETNGKYVAASQVLAPLPLQRDRDASSRTSRRPHQPQFPAPTARRSSSVRFESKFDNASQGPSTGCTAGPSRSPERPIPRLQGAMGESPQPRARRFRARSPGAPLGWGPLHADVIWLQGMANGGKSKNRVIRFTLNEEVAGMSGVLYYSDPFPVEKGATYRFQCRWKSTGSVAKVFIKCYDELPTEFRAGPVAGRSKIEGREVYRSQQNLEGVQGSGMCRPRTSRPCTAGSRRAGASDALRVLASRHGRAG